MSGFINAWFFNQTSVSNLRPKNISYVAIRFEGVLGRETVLVLRLENFCIEGAAECFVKLRNCGFETDGMKQRCGG
ncbi:hypothetical protein V6N13_126526 [Hibiscus sabdariffa]|uniref:Uncharacterized protein n=1 Tax=Hibiscus sabdariffa TaxID=183260 RepID=A0ABR2RF88_9ROSI